VVTPSTTAFLFTNGVSKVGTFSTLVQELKKYNYLPLNIKINVKSSKLVLNKSPFFVILKLANKIIECQNRENAKICCERRGLES